MGKIINLRQIRVEVSAQSCDNTAVAAGRRLSDWTLNQLSSTEWYCRLASLCDVLTDLRSHLQDLAAIPAMVSLLLTS
uniref:Uncharacterized protein n=1 Tax=Echinococcus canadensis TaxID=519352 RepID=A0A915EY82_9CEST